MKILIKNGKLINKSKIYESDILIDGEFIEKIAINISDSSAKIIDANGKFVIPGVIDDQVHFREPGLTHKADISSESRAAVAGGVTSFMEMPNVKPPSVTIEKLEEKYEIASRTSAANYSFYMGTTNDNYDELMRVDPKSHCGIKIFMGSSTGNMLVDNEKTLGKIFANSPALIAIHSENDAIIAENMARAAEKYGDDIPFDMHPEIRSVESCYNMTEFAIGIAKKHNTRLHVLHITTEEELEFFDNSIPLSQKRITAEVCAHHLWFDSEHYAKYGALIKCNPSIKAPRHKAAILKAVLDDRIDVIASDHAPHTWEEKQNKYAQAPSGLPLVQHTLSMLLEMSKEGKISIEKVVDKMCHKPAELFQISKRGFLEEGYFADIAIIDYNSEWQVGKENILYKCNWSPFEGEKFTTKVTDTIVSGNHMYSYGKFLNNSTGKRLEFEK